MTTEFVFAIAKEGIWIAFLASAPVLVAGMVVGIVISVFQAVTQIQDQSISFVPKLVASVAVIALAGPWIVNKLIYFTAKILGDLKHFIR